MTGTDLCVNIPVLPNPRERGGAVRQEKFFWDCQGVIHVDFPTDARTVNATYYSDLLATDVKRKISTCSEGSNQTCKACGLRTTTPSSRLFGIGYAASHKPFLKRASGCFQNVGKSVLIPEGSTFGNYGFQKKMSPGHI
jgi:hypothetical protein